MRYLTVTEVIRMHEAEVGDDLLADLGLVDAAVQRPQQSVYGRDAYADIHAKAAALFQSLARNHGFIDGNKRVAVTAVGVFYLLNGWVLRTPDQGDLVALAVDTADAHLTVEVIADTLKGWAEPAPVPDDE
ncbi:MAG TPA: type II toxin-antitoxin system death-on-curing family toxin [Frankiaceae bacterium]|nr:type II toxin-antitoxin system death-on-curing family toxin [Frankiaceae bacterium]